MINHNGRECKKNVYIHTTESLCCTAEINTTLQIDYTSIKKKEEEKKNAWGFQLKTVT